MESKLQEDFYQEIKFKLESNLHETFGQLHYLKAHFTCKTKSNTFNMFKDIYFCMQLPSDLQIF